PVAEVVPLVREGVAREAEEADLEKLEGPEALSQVLGPAHPPALREVRLLAVEVRVHVDRVERVAVGAPAAPKERSQERRQDDDGRSHTPDPRAIGPRPARPQ